MRKVQRSEILDLGAYEQLRDRFLKRIIADKRHRRVSVGDHMTFIFENRDTDKDERARMLAALHDLKQHVFLVLGDRRVPGAFELLPGEEDTRLPAVNYVRFTPGAEAAHALRDGSTRAALGVDHPAYNEATELDADIRAQLAADLEEP